LITESRREIAKLLNKFEFSINKTIFLFIFSLITSLMVAFIPHYEGMSSAANWTLFILLFSALLWMTEAIPAFAVSLLLISLEILILGQVDGVYATTQNDWKLFISPWASSLIFLFIGGFILALAASKTKLDIWIAKRVLGISGSDPKNILTGLMAVTFVFSMFISNTATTSMMLTILVPIIYKLKKDNPFNKTLLLGVAAAANIGGMGTIIGTPPNAIAIGALGENAPSFLGWMFYAVPPAIILIVFIRYVLLKLYPSNESTIKIDFIESINSDDETTAEKNKTTDIPSWHKLTVIVVFITTLLLWLSSSVHHLPTAVVAFLPIVVFTMTGIVDAEDIRTLPWEILLLITGGLSLGLAVSNTGLASWVATAIPTDTLDIFGVVIIFSFLVVLVSNFMSNTAATNILIPIIIAIITGFTNDNQMLTNTVIIVALSASNAMLLSVSTPPNAIVYSTGMIKSKNFLTIGVIIGLIGPIVIMSWIYMIFG